MESLLNECLHISKYCVVFGNLTESLPSHGNEKVKLSEKRKLKVVSLTINDLFVV